MGAPERLTATVAARLGAAGCVAATEEAEELLAAAGGDRDTLEKLVARRERGEPLAWLTGVATFCGRPVHVHPGVYVPRPQTQELADRAARFLRTTGGPAADLCTGSGAVAVHLMADVPEAGVVGVDLDQRAVRCARANAVPAVVGDLDGPLGSGIFGLVTAVAPYVPTGALHLLPSDVRRFEPPLALEGGADGLEVLRRVVCGAARILRPGGWLVTELGGEQDRLIAPDLEALGFFPADTWADAEGDLRGLAARLGSDRPVPGPEPRPTTA